MALGHLPRNPVRFIVATSIAVLVWGVTAAGWLDRTIVPQLDRGLRDFYLALTVDARADSAPGLLHLAFDNEALASTGLPTRVPLAALREMLDAARGSHETIVLDVDLATRSDLADDVEFLAFLTAWASDAAAPLLVLAYPLYDIAYHGMAAFQSLDALIAASPNIRWAGVGTFADTDGVVRSYEYWSCVDRSGAGSRSALPSVAMYVWARHLEPDIATTTSSVDAAMRVADPYCKNDARVAATQIFGQALPQNGIIEYQTSVDALAAGGDSRYAPDGLPRLISVGFCRISPAGCGTAGGPTDIAAVAARRIIIVSAANEFSRDEHATPVGYMAGSVILGNAARALINAGPPVTLSTMAQLALVIAAAVLIHIVWAAFEHLRVWLRRGTNWPRVRKLTHGVMNPAVVQWLAFGAADVLIFIYYYHGFGSSEWNGLVGASFGATTVAAIGAFNEWWSTPWDEVRTEDSK